MNETKAVLRHSRIYAIAALLNRGAAFFIIPIHTHFLQESEYGIIGVINITSEIVGVMFGLKLGAAMSRVYFDYETDLERNTVVSSAILGAMIIIGMILLPLAFASEPLARLVLDTKGMGGLMFLGMAGLLLNTLFTFALQYELIRQKSTTFLVASTARVVAYVLVTLILVAGFKMGLRGAVLGIVIGNGLAVVAVVVPLLKRLGFRFSRKHVKNMLAFGAPLVPGQVAEIGGNFAERYLVVHLASLAASGIYYLALRLGMVISSLIVGPFNRIYLVRRLEAHGSQSQDTESSRVFTYFFVVVVFSALVLAAMAPEFVRIAAPSGYATAVGALPLVCLAQVLVSLLVITELGLYYAKASRRLTTANITMLLSQVALNLLFIPRFGIVGASLALASASAIRLGVTTYLARGLGGPRVEWGSVAVLLAAAFAWFAASRAIDLASGWGVVVGKSVLVAAFPVLVIASPLFSHDERRALVRFAVERGRRLFRGARLEESRDA